MTNVRFFTQKTLIRQTKGQKGIRNQTKQLLRLYAVFRSWVVCLRTLPEPTVGPTHVRRSILKECGKRSPRAHLKQRYTETAEHFINIREQLGPSLGVIQGGAPHHRSPNAPTLADRDPNYTLWAEDDARTPARQWTKTLCRIRGTYKENEETFFSTKNGVESGIYLDHQPRTKRNSLCCGASMHMDTPAVLSLGKLCEENGYSYVWKEGKTPNLFHMAKLYLTSVSTSCPSLFPENQVILTSLVQQVILLKTLKS